MTLAVGWPTQHEMLSLPRPKGRSTFPISRFIRPVVGLTLPATPFVAVLSAPPCASSDRLPPRSRDLRTGEGTDPIYPKTPETLVETAGIAALHKEWRITNAMISKNRFWQDKIFGTRLLTARYVAHTGGKVHLEKHKTAKVKEILIPTWFIRGHL